MKLKRIAMSKVSVCPPVTTPPKKERKKSSNTLPSDAYQNEFDPMEIVVDEKRKVVCSVMRGGIDGLPLVDIRVFNTTDTYCGPSKKGLRIPIECIVDLIDTLQEVQDKCEECGLFEEVE